MLGASQVGSDGAEDLILDMEEREEKKRQEYKTETMLLKGKKKEFTVNHIIYIFL